MATQHAGSLSNMTSSSNGQQQHSAADLLRQSLVHASKVHGVDDDAHDHIGSGANTPPGAMTPRPDLHDKRLPGIINSYFGQVRESLRIGGSAEAAIPAIPPTHPSAPAPPRAAAAASSSSSASTPAPAPAPAVPTSATSYAPGSAGQEPSVTTPAASMSGSTNRLLDSPVSPLSRSTASSVSPLVLPRLDEGRDGSNPAQLAYPSPPLSSGSSTRAKNSDVSDASRPKPKRSWHEKRRNLSSLTLSLRRRWSSNAAPATAQKAPVASARVSDLSVVASVANPAIPSSTHPSSPPSLFSSSSTSSSSVSSPQRRSHVIESNKLTSGAAPHQSTPPQTPRSFSRASGHDDRSLQSKAVLSRRSSYGSNHATIGQLKGQLEVCIQEGRGLRPSVEPYVVCIFQLNEDISGGPREDSMDTSVESAARPIEENLARGVAMKRIGSGSGHPITIPGLRSRQTSQTNIAELRRGSVKESGSRETTDPIWRHTATFDVVGENNEIDISVYDRSHNESFIGHVRLPLALDDYEHQHEGWYKLQSREGESDHVTGEVRLKIAFKATGKRIFRPDDFEILKLIGKGTFGQVFQVRKKDTKRIYAMKVLSKKLIVQKKEIQHTIGERNILVRTATSESPFIVGLKFSFQTSADLYLVTDYMSGGELFWHLQREGRFLEDRAKFYIAELILALRHLHQHDIVYRDLKPENILLDANGHIALCDFGLSKANLAKNDTTNTFCGTTEYLAPEVLLDEQGYTKMVDFWSLGVLVFEMCCGWSPFYADDTQQMYKNIAFGKVRFPRDALSQEGRNFVKGLLNRNPAHRLGARGDAEELMAHPFFADVDWNALSKKLTQPPFKPKLKGELDTSNFDPEFTNALNDQTASSLNARAAALASGINTDSTPLSPTMQNQFKGFTFVDESMLEQQYGEQNADDMDVLDESASKTFSSRKGDRMSGIEAPSSAADADFNHGMLDDI